MSDIKLPETKTPAQPRHRPAQDGRGARTPRSRHRQDHHQWPALRELFPDRSAADRGGAAFDGRPATTDKFDAQITVSGGGPTGQAGAVRHGLARALLTVDVNFRPVLKAEGHLTRDSREKERKKYGQPGARKRFQYSKR